MLDELIQKIQQSIHQSHNNSQYFCSELLQILSEYISIQPSLEQHVLQEKVKHLFNPNVQTDLLRQFPFCYSQEHFAILDTNLKFLQVNPIYAQVTGYRQADDLIGLSYEDFKGDVVSQCELFKGQDLQVLETQKSLEFLSYHHYGDGQWHLLWGEKSLLFDEKQNPCGVFSKAKDMTGHPLMDMTRFLMKEAHYHFGRFQQKSFIYYVEKDHHDFGMTAKEKEILFYLVRGKTVSDIANLLSRSKRTVDMHVESLKEKFLVESKSQLIEKAIMLGYMNFIPKTFLRNLS